MTFAEALVMLAEHEAYIETTDREQYQLCKPGQSPLSMSLITFHALRRRKLITMPQYVAGGRWRYYVSQHGRHYLSQRQKRS